MRNPKLLKVYFDNVQPWIRNYTSTNSMEFIIHNL